MSDFSNVVAVKLDGEEISLRELLRYLKISEKLAFVKEGIAELLVARAAKTEGLTVNDEELQAAVDLFRNQRGLHKADETQQWLAEKRWNVDDLEQHLEQQILRNKLTDKIATEESIEQHFSKHRHAYDRAVLAHIAVSDEEVAQELLTQIQEENADFAELAKRHSVDKATKSYGGELGVADRSSLSPAVESAVFSANDGDVVGPIKTDMGYHLIKVHHLLLGKLDKDAAAAIRGDLFTEWLDNQRTTANVQVPLYDVI